MLACLLALVLICLGAALGEENGGRPLGQMTVVNCEEWVSLRAKPDTQSERLNKVPLGAQVTAWDVGSDSFYRCQYQDASGYILKKYLQLVPVIGDAARAWAALSGDDSMVEGLQSMDERYQRKPAQVEGIGSYAEWLLERNTYADNDTGLFLALADDCAGTNNGEVGETLRQAEAKLILAEIYEWEGTGLNIEFYEFAVAGQQILFFCYSEPDGGELTQFLLIP